MFRRIAPLALPVVMAALLSACATETPYSPADNRGYGFTEQKIESDRYRITFAGNSLTDRQTVETYLLYRAAELTLQNGFDFFQLTENDTEAKRTYTSTGPNSPIFYGRFGFPGYYAYGWGWGYPYDTTVREVRRYSATAYVRMGAGEKPADDPLAYDARDVVANLGPLITRS